MRRPLAASLIQEIAPSLGITVRLEPEFGFVGELSLPSGRRHLFKDASLNVNGAGSSDVAKDKANTKFFLRSHGIAVPSGQTFFSSRLNANLDEHKRRSDSEAHQYAARLGFTVYVKPNSSSEGAFVTKATSANDLSIVLERLFSVHDVVLIEQPASGDDFRLIVLDGRLEIAYRRIPLQVVGDGKSELEALILRASDHLKRSRRNAKIDVNDFRIDLKLSSEGKDRAWIPELGRVVQLLDCANLSAGGTPADVTDLVHPEFVAIAVRAAEALGLAYCGVDLLAAGIGLSPSTQDWTIIELSSAPGLDNYYSLGGKPAERVHDLYRHLLISLMSPRYRGAN